MSLCPLCPPLFFCSKAMEDFKLKHAHKYVVFKWVKDEDERLVEVVVSLCHWNCRLVCLAAIY